MTKNNDIRYYGKMCSISYKPYPATEEFFYVNRNSEDGLHPYCKKIDNFRRTTGASVKQIRKLFN